MTYELIPPTEDFFSQQWYEKDGFGMKMMTDSSYSTSTTVDLYSRVDSTRSKLTALEVKLGQRLDWDKYSTDLRSFLDRVNWLRNYIGIWTSGTVMPHGKWDAERVYPYSKHLISRWPDELFGERKEGNVLILLSPSTVNWLNRVDEWVSSSYSTSTTVSV